MIIRWDHLDHLSSRVFILNWSSPHRIYFYHQYHSCKYVVSVNSMLLSYRLQGTFWEVSCVLRHVSLLIFSQTEPEVFLRRTNKGQACWIKGEKVCAESSPGVNPRVSHGPWRLSRVELAKPPGCQWWTVQIHQLPSQGSSVQRRSNSWEPLHTPCIRTQLHKLT